MTDIADEERLLDELATALEVSDPIPDHVLAAAKEAIFWRTVDAELARLVFDSSVDTVSSVRGTETARQVTFRSPGIEIEIMITDGTSRRLIGQLIPPQPAEAELRFGDEVRSTPTDRLGRFSFVDVPPGPIQLAVRSATGPQVVTEWLEI